MFPAVIRDPFYTVSSLSSFHGLDVTELLFKCACGSISSIYPSIYRYDKQEYDPESKTGSKADYYTYGVICAEVEIDVLTGENQV